MAYRDIGSGGKKNRNSRGDVKRREKRIAELEKDLKSEHQKYQEKIAQMTNQIEQLKVFRFCFFFLCSLLYKLLRLNPIWHWHFFCEL